MTIGDGIAIAGVWLFAAAATASREVSGIGMLLAIIVASVATGWIVR